MFLKNNAQPWPIYIKVAILAIVVGTLWIFNSAYVTPLLLGMIFAVLTAPIYRFIIGDYGFKKLNFAVTVPKPLGAILTIVSICVVLGFILNRFVFEVVNEAPIFISQISGFFTSLTTDQQFLSLLEQYRIDPEAVNAAVKTINSGLKSLLSILGRDVRTENQLMALDKESVDAALRFGGSSVKNLANYLIATVIFVLAWFNSLIHGKNWIAGIFALLPFDSSEETQIRQDIKDGVQNVIYANLLSGFVHAAVCFVLMLLFGIPNLFILTVIIFFIGVLPLSPSELSYAIALSLIAMKTGNLPLIVLFAIISELIVLWVNYVLVPKIISSKNEGNDLLILTSILSGITIFGLMGFIIGPIIMIVVQTLYSILNKRLAAEKLQA